MNKRDEWNPMRVYNVTVRELRKGINPYGSNGKPLPSKQAMMIVTLDHFKQICRVWKKANPKKDTSKARKRAEGKQ